MIRCKASFLFFFALALWAAIFFSPRLIPQLWWAGAAVIPAGAIVALRLPSVRARRAGLLVLAASIALVTGVLRIAVPLRARQAVGPGLALERVRGFSGWLAQDSGVLPAGGGARYRVSLRSVWSKGGQIRASTGGQVLVLAKEGPRLYWGRRITVFGSLRPSLEPGRHRYISRVTGGALTPDGYRSRLQEARAAAHLAIERRLSALDPPVAGLLDALLLGNREDIPEDVAALFRESGSLHVLALSGLHVGILYALASFLLSFLPGKRLRVAAGSFLLFLYLLLAGFTPSLERAVIMLLAGAIAFLLDRDIRPLNLLALAAAAILLFDPWSAAELSFQLSFLALLGILLLGPAVQRLLAPVLPPALSLPLSYSLGAQVATAPLLFSLFGTAYPAGALAALPLIPLVTVFLWSGLVYLLLAVLPVSFLLKGLYGAILLVLKLFAGIPPLQIFWRPAYWIPVVLLFSLLLVVFPRPRPEGKAEAPL